MQGWEFFCRIRKFSKETYCIVTSSLEADIIHIKYFVFLNYLLLRVFNKQSIYKEGQEKYANEIFSTSYNGSFLKEISSPL